MRSTAELVSDLIGPATGGSVPVRVRTWDGSEAGPATGPVLVLRRRRALRRLFWSPGELGLGRAYVSGDLDVEGDLFAALEALLDARRASAGGGLVGDRPPRPGAVGRLAAALRVGAVGLPPAPPSEEVRLGRGPRHTRNRDAVAVGSHYDVGNDFYRLLLGPSMVYSCAYWDDDLDPSSGDGLDRAQHDKLDLVASKLALRPGMRLLDVGCGWGSMVLHAAQRYGVSAVGVTVSREQAELARARVAEAGLEDRVEIRLQDYRDVTDGPYDAVCSVGMAEHVGRAELQRYAEGLYRLLAPGGRLLNHAISSHHDPGLATSGPSFVEAYVFPDGELERLSGTVTVLEDAGFEVRDVHALREHYELTLRAWVARLQDRWEEAVALVGEGRARVWLLYMVGSAVGFTRSMVGVDQVLAVRPDEGRSGMPLRREASW